MSQEKLEFMNRDNKKIVVIIDYVKNSKGLAIVMHGLGGLKEQPHIVTFSEAFLESGYTVVRFDVTHTFGESEGNYENATTTNYYNDLCDVITWAKDQKWYQEPFILAGHSLGGISVALFAENYPEKVKAVAPISTVISGKLHAEAIPKEKLDEYNKTGWKISPSKSIPGLMKKLNWKKFTNDLEKYDLLDKVNKLTMPVLLITGESDGGTPPRHQRILYEKLPGKKELHIIKNAPHTFKEKEHLDEIKAIFLQWIKKI